MSLNPCCSGRWSRTCLTENGILCSLEVLILVVVDDGLVLWVNRSDKDWCEVLILVVVDDGLVLMLKIKAVINRVEVLILVVVDDGLVRV